MKIEQAGSHAAGRYAQRWMVFFLWGLMSVARAESVWIDAGRSHITVIADAEILAMDPDARTNRDRLPLYWAVHDLVDYLEKISDIRPVLASEPQPGTMPVRVRVLEEGESLTLTSELGDVYRLDIRADGVDLAGEAMHSTAYAVYHLLHELGVRWYGPEAWNEILPVRERIAFTIGTREFAPDYQSRHVWGLDPRWLLRNRMGGPSMPQGHGFHAFMQGREPRDEAPLVERHPEYYPMLNGQVRGRQANLSHPDVLERAITHVRERFERFPDALGLAIGPDDGALQDHRLESRAMMSGRADPLSPQYQDATDLMVRFANRVAEAVYDEYPDKLLGFYVYSNHKTVPGIAPHPMLFPKVAPISYTRYTYIGAPHSPTAVQLERTMREWQRLSPRIGFYLYNFNLADHAMPFTRVSVFRRDLPNLYRWGYRHATIESGANWHTMIPGNYMIGQLLWDVDTDVDALLDEFYPLYYGPAAAAMRDHDRLLEDAYENASAYAGNKWSMHRILTPEIMAGLADALDHARQAAGDREPYARRVSVPGYSLRFAQGWFRAQEALQQFDFIAAAGESRAFLDAYQEAVDAGLTTGELIWRDRSGQSHRNFFAANARRYWEIFHHLSFVSAEAVARDGRSLLQLPDVWKAWFDYTCIGESLGLADPRSPKDSWLDLKTYSATIDEQGFPFFRGLIWYALDIEVPDFMLAEGEAVFLWFGGNDNNTRVFLDGRFAGEFRTSNFNPAEIDVTPHLRSGTRQHLVVSVDNRPVYELGTGGIMRPALVYIRNLRPDEEPAPVPAPDDIGPEDRPLFGGE